MSVPRACPSPSFRRKPEPEVLRLCLAPVLEAKTLGSGLRRNDGMSVRIAP